MENVLPPWLSPYLIYFDVNAEDASFLLLSFGLCMLFNVYRIFKNRPWLRQICLLGVVAYIGKRVL